MIFADIHCHALCGSDDGPENREDMYKLINTMYDDNIRYICLTPHFHPGYFGENANNSVTAFNDLREYVSKKYSDLKIYLGNELRYNQGCVNWIKEKRCRSLNNTEYILIDFHDNQSVAEIIHGTNSILNAGYVPILAHVERYTRLNAKLKLISELKENGVIIQIDAQSVIGQFGFFTKLRAKKIIDARLADVIATDAHDTDKRAPCMIKSYEYIKDRCGEKYAKRITFDVPHAIICNKYSGRN
ncbi:MAG: hypothetical protein IKU52_05785 [Clostridia bacterium]|nr:hypothetical protein [Clostridia bacterium]